MLAPSATAIEPALREPKHQSASPFVFLSKRGGPFTPSGFAKLLASCRQRSQDGVQGPPAYAPACLRLLGHRSINSTTRYAALAPRRFKNTWGKGEMLKLLIHAVGRTGIPSVRIDRSSSNAKK